MKRKTIYNLLIIVAFALAGCDDLESFVPENSTTVEDGTGGLYILCDGNYSLNNSTLALYNFNSSTLKTDIFQSVNKRKLGDTGNDLQRYGSKIYVVVNASSQIEVLDARTGQGIKQIPLFDGTKARQPRYIAFWKGKAYVCSFDGTVAKIDTTSLETESFITVGRNPDGIAASNGKLYVSNSGGLDYASSLGYDNTVSVIDASTFSETKRITVGLNPGRIKSDSYGSVYVAVRGDYKSVAGTWKCIDSRTDQVVAGYNLPVTNFDLYGTKAYLYSYDNDSKKSWIKVFDLKAKEVVQESFIKDGTEITTPYGLNVNPANGDIYITDAGNYVSLGDVLCFSQDGLLKYRIANVGISPNTVLYVEDYAEGGSVEEDTATTENKYLYKVLDYTPAPGQFIGTYPVYKPGESDASMLAKAEALLKGSSGGLVTLGRYGGSLTFAFKNAVRNVTDSKDFRIKGNAFSNSAEPGIVQVSVDANHNGLADDVWYELAGSEYSKATTTKNFSITYYRPSSLSDSVLYRNSLGKTGYVNASYPVWKGDSIVCKGILLPPTAVQNATGYWELCNLDWGYADNQPNQSDLSCFDIEWAVDGNGKSVHLDAIDFIRVYTGVNQNAGWIGELSTEIAGAENLHP